MPVLKIGERTIPADPRAIALYLTGDLIEASVGELEKAVQRHLEQGRSRILIDLDHAKGIDPAGLGTLVNLSDTVQQAGGGIALLRTPPATQQMIDIMGLMVFFEICPDERAGLLALASSKRKP